MGEPLADGYVRARGALHVHTTFSDGGGTPADVAAAARGAGLDFVAITDHNNLDAAPSAGVHGGVHVLVGSEISTTHGHLVALGIRPPDFRFSGDAVDAFDDVRWLGGHAFAAHPQSPREDLRFTGWDLPGGWGVELMNGDTAWRAGGPLRIARALVAYPFDARFALALTLREPRETLARWDELLSRRPAPGIAGADAHERLGLRRPEGDPRGLALPLPSYEAMLGLFVNHVLLDGPADSASIVAALAAGRSYVAVDAVADGGGFGFVAESPAGRVTMGESVEPSPDLVLRAGGRLPSGARLRLMRDGREVAASEHELQLAAPPPGIYRVEVRLPGWDFPWILSNAIAVLPAAEQAARVERAGRPPEVDAPAAVELIDDFAGPSTFGAEFDPSSAMEPPVVVPGAGPDGSPAARIAFRLGQPGPGRPYTWTALVSREARDLSGHQGLSFAIRSDRPYRIWVQVRDDNPASADDGTEWWFASVRTTPEWRLVALPFERFRSINPRTDGRLDLDRVRQLVFVLDHGAIAPGTAGEIVLDDVGVY